jgi:thiazole synthase
MAEAFAQAIEAGRTAFEAGPIEMRDMAQPSTPVAGTPFFDLPPNTRAGQKPGQKS